MSALQEAIEELVPVDPRIESMNILLLDIETYPAKTYQWSLWDKFTPIERIIESGGVLCFAAKWYGDPEVTFSSLWDDGVEGMGQTAYDLLNTADAVVTYNGDRFDLPWLRHLMHMENGLPPVFPFVSIDLFGTMRQFRFLSKKLDFVVQSLDIGQKVDTYGFQMWLDAMPEEIGGNGLAEAQQAMKDYNIGDVSGTLEPLYDEVLPHIKGHPHVALYAPGDRCHNCGQMTLEEAGLARTPLGVYPRARCTNCGKPHRGKSRIIGVDYRGV